MDLKDSLNLEMICTGHPWLIAEEGGGQVSQSSFPAPRLPTVAYIYQGAAQ